MFRRCWKNKEGLERSDYTGVSLTGDARPATSPMALQIFTRALLRSDVRRLSNGLDGS